MSEIMPDKRFTEVVDGQQVVRTLAVGGDIIPEPAKDPSKYFTALVNTDDGPQQVVKMFLMGIADGGNAGLIKIVDALPATGSSGFLYGVLRPELDREGYGIIQFFVWYEGVWKATGAYSIDIDPDTLLYKTDKNVANGVAGLNASAQLSSSVIPYATANDVGGIKQSFDATTGTWTVITESI